MKDLSTWAALLLLLSTPAAAQNTVPTDLTLPGSGLPVFILIVSAAWCIGESGDGARRRTNCGLEQIGPFRAIGCEEPGLSRVRISCSPPFGFIPAIHCSANVVLGVTFTRIKRT